MPEGVLPFRRMLLVGVGLIGGSLALALRRAGLVQEIVGIGRPGGSLAQAQALRVIDRAEEDLARAAQDADLIVLATPAGVMPELLQALAPALHPESIVTDVGSVKAGIALAGRGLRRFCPGHPIAGAETAGVAAARADLFLGRPVVLTPTPDTDAAVLARVRGLWRAVGAEVYSLAPEEHDRVLALTSHLPHLAAFGASSLFGLEGHFDAALRPFVGTGFCDFSRIAASDPVMWRDICVQNQGPLLAVLARYRAVLGTLEGWIESGDGPALEGFFKAAQQVRREAPCPGPASQCGENVPE